MAEEQRGGRSGQNNRGNRNQKQSNSGQGSNGQGGGRKRNRNRGRGKQDKESSHPGKPFTGMLEMIGDKNFGFIRGFDPSLPKGDNDPFMPPPIIDKYNLRDGVLLEGHHQARPQRRLAGHRSRQGDGRRRRTSGRSSGPTRKG